MNIEILKKIMKVVAILAICLISFVGIYVKENGFYKNVVKDYDFAADLTGYRELIFDISDALIVLDSEGNKVGNTDGLNDETISQNSFQKSETKVNNDEDKNVENYNKVKEIIEERLKGLGTQDYNISVNEETGKIFLRLAENEETDHTISNLLQVGKFQIRDSEDESKVLIDGKDLKKVSAVYNTTENGTTVYLQIELNKDATTKFADITENEYKTIDNSSEESTSDTEEDAENTENTDSAEKVEEKQKQVTLAIDDNKLITTSFDTPIKDGVIDLSMGNSTKDADKVSENLKSASTIAIVLNSGDLPLTYKVVENKYVKQGLLDTCKDSVMYFCIGAIVFLIVIMIIKYRSKGFLGGVSFAGYIALLVLLIRYANVMLTANSIVAIVLMSIVSYAYIWRMLKINEADIELKKKQFTKEFKFFIFRTIPLAIIAFTFSFMKWETISTFGMVTFWGLALAIIYNFIITKKIID